MDSAGVGLGCGEGRVITMVIIIGTDNNCAITTTWYCDLIIGLYYEYEKEFMFCYSNYPIHYDRLINVCNLTTLLVSI